MSEVGTFADPWPGWDHGDLCHPSGLLQYGDLCHPSELLHGLQIPSFECPRLVARKTMMNRHHMKTFQKKNFEAKLKKVSASTNPTDRVLKRRLGTFFRFLVRCFLAPLRAWPVASLITIAREKSTSKNSSKGKEILFADPGF